VTEADLRATAILVRELGGYAADRSFSQLLGLARRLDRLADEWEQRQAVIDAAVKWRASRFADEWHPIAANTDQAALVAAIDALGAPNQPDSGAA
jgi:hypothetical protein